MPIELAKTNLYVAEAPFPGILLAKTNLYVVDNGEPEQPTTMRISQAVIQSVSIGSTTSQVDGAVAQVAYTFPSQKFEVSAANLTLPVDQEKTFQINKASLQVVCAARPELAYVRAWTFTLDGHEYYVLQLQSLTLVYDLHSQQWYNWGSKSLDIWRGQIGIDWNANLGRINGGFSELGVTSILVGDYEVGTLYFLHTGLNEDVGPEGVGYLPFQRLLYGQIPVRGHDYMACDGVELAGSIGETSGATDQTVTLAYSDDVGHTFVSAGPITVAPGAYDFTLQWPSLGSFKGPGRLFRIEDWGAIHRVDGIDMDDGNG